MRPEPQSSPGRRRCGITPLKARRLARGQTIREVAEATGIHKNYIAVWELGGECPAPADARKLARHFGIPVRDLDVPIDLAPRRAPIDPHELDRIADRIAKHVVKATLEARELIEQALKAKAK